MPSTTSTRGWAASRPLLAPPLDTAALAERIGHGFADPDLLTRALHHRSWCAEHPGTESNERLEFLGDAVLGLVVAHHVFSTYPDHDEGWLSRARSSVVRASALAEMADSLGLGPFLKLGKGEDASGGREKRSILADAVEAIIGALYVDGGWPAAEALVLAFVAPRVAALPGGRGDQDDKSLLQEFSTRRLHEAPRYDVVEHGPEHDKTFLATALLAGRPWGTGTGRSKKQAEQEAAREALEALADVIVDPTVDFPPPPAPMPARDGDPTDA